jgi:hypothetical protein
VEAGGAGAAAAAREHRLVRGGGGGGARGEVVPKTRRGAAESVERHDAFDEKAVVRWAARYLLTPFLVTLANPAMATEIQAREIEKVEQENLPVDD